MCPIGNASDEIIRHAMQEGAFDNLPGKGKPLNLDVNPHEPEELRLAYRMLHSNGYTLPWLELRKEIEESLEKARADIREVWQRGDKRRWDARLAEFQHQIEALNKQIFQYNLQAPSTQFHRPMIDLAQEIEAVQHRASPPPPQEAEIS